MTVYPHPHLSMHIASFRRIGDFLLNLNRKRFNFRITTSRFTFFSMLSRSQKIEGVTSQVYDKNGKTTNFHYPMWDLEGKNIEETKKTLKKVQTRYGLPNIYLTTDNNGKTYRGWCFVVVHFC